MLTPAENEVIKKLIEAWDKFVLLPPEHPDDIGEFRQGIHRLQDKVLCRPARREFNTRSGNG